jgi:hypothetical protein
LDTIIGNFTVTENKGKVGGQSEVERAKRI